MSALNIRTNNGKDFAYLVKRKKKPIEDRNKVVSWYLGPVNEDTLEKLIEAVSQLMIHISSDDGAGNRVRCPMCRTPVSKLGIEDVVACKLFQRLEQMEKSNEDVFNAEEYETLKLVAETLTK